MQRGTPRQRAIAKAAELEVLALRDGMRRKIATSLVNRFPAYGLPPCERTKNVLRLFLWEMTAEREQLLRVLTACYRNLPDHYRSRTGGEGSDEGASAPY